MILNLARTMGMTAQDLTSRMSAHELMEHIADITLEGRERKEAAERSQR